MKVVTLPFNAQSIIDNKTNIFPGKRCCSGIANYHTQSSLNFNTQKGSGISYLYVENSNIAYDLNVLQHRDKSIVYDLHNLQLSYRSFAYESRVLQLSDTSFAYESQVLQLSNRSFVYESQVLQLSNRSFVYDLPSLQLSYCSIIHDWRIQKIQNILYTTDLQAVVSAAFILKHHGAIF